MSRFNAVAKPSAPPGARIRDWAGLIEILKARLSAGDAGTLRRLPSDYLRVAQLHETQFQRSRLLAVVDEALASIHFAPGPAHFRLKRFPWEAIVTTNYDSLIEQAYDNDRTRPIVKIVWDQDLTCRRPPNGLLLIKMHGDLGLPDSIVLTEEDYRCYEHTRPGVALKVKQLMLEHPTMFVGFSLSDPNVAAIEGWIRDTTGRLRLPSIVLVHTEPLIAERDMWARRGIQLIHIREPEQNLIGFLDALHGESMTDAPHAHVPQRESADNQALLELLKEKPKAWETDAAKLLARLTQSANDSDFSDAAHHALHGGFYGIKLESIRAILSELEPDTRRSFFLRAHRSDVPFAFGADRDRIDLEQELLADAALSAEQRAEVLIRRATRLERMGDLAGAKASLVEARDLGTTNTGQIERRLRAILLRIGDEASIATELLDGPVREDAFAYALRGSVALMTRGREAARRWYAEALKAARDGDEKTAALSGLQASQDPGDWSDYGDLDEQRRAILPSERPRVEKLWALEADAGELLLDRYRKGSKNSGAESEQAIEKLRTALAEADDMGWPKCPGPNYTTAADGLAYAIVGICLHEGATAEQLKSGLTLIVERGLMSLERHLDRALLDRLLAEPELSNWVRELLGARSGALYMKRSRTLLRSALLPMIPDDAIDAHVAEVVVLDDLKRERKSETTSTELHLELLRPHFRALPRSAALHLIGIVSQVVADADLRLLSHARWLQLPISDWMKVGTISTGDAELADLKSSLERGFRDGLASPDSFAASARYWLLSELHAAKGLSDEELTTFQSLLDNEIAVRSAEAQNDEPYATLEAVRMREALGSWSPPDMLHDMFMSAYRRLRNSTAAGTWVNAINVLAPLLSQEDRLAVASSVDDYLEACFKDREHFLGPVPIWAATGVHQAAKAQIFSPEEARSRLLRLASEFPDCAPFALGLDGVDGAQAEEFLMRGIVSGTVDENDILRWCSWWPSARTSSSRFEALLFGRLFSPQPEIRRGAYLAISILAKKDALSESARGDFKDAMLKFGVRDHHWGPRAAAIVGTSRLSKDLDTAQIEAVLSTGVADRSADVRRVTAMLERALAVRS